MKISVIIPAYNNSLIDVSITLDSLVNQTFKDFDVIVVDDNNIKDVRALISSYSTKFKIKHIINTQRQGIASSINIGIQQSTSNYIARLDFGDVCFDNRLETQFYFLEKNKNIVVCGSNIELFNDDKTLGKVVYPENHFKILKGFIFHSPIAHPSVMFRKKDIEEVGAYSEKLFFGEDVDLWLKLIKNEKKFFNIQEVLLRYKYEAAYRKKEHYKNILRLRLKHFYNLPFYISVLGIILTLINLILPNKFLGLIRTKFLSSNNHV